jgi:hypothetical protein
MRWRRESAPDVHAGAFVFFLFVSRWLFVDANEKARVAAVKLRLFNHEPRCGSGRSS